MNNNFIDFNKKSKKEQRKIYAEKRGSWGAINPVTRMSRDNTKYNRNVQKAAMRRERGC